MVTVYRSETVISKTEIDAPTPEQALKVARALEGMSTQPEYTEIKRQGLRISLSEDIGTRKPKAAPAK